jgi:hypothetical protein
MLGGWLFLKVSAGVELALPPTAIHKLLHRGAPEFSERLPEALDLGSHLGCGSDPSLPGVLVVLGSGVTWLVGDVALQGLGERLSYLPLAPDLFAVPPPWCRGVLSGAGRWAFVVAHDAMGKAVA